MAHASPKAPNWDDLFDLAASQDGLFSTAQAGEAGYSPQLLQKHLRAGRVQRVRRGVYRLVHFPPGEHEDLAAVWIWSTHAGVFSHETALSLHGLSDVLPARVHLTMPSAWKLRRLRIPQGVVLAYANVPTAERTWAGSVPVTSVRRTLADCLATGVAPDLMHQAIRQAADRGLVPKAELARLTRPGRATAGRAPRLRGASGGSRMVIAMKALKAHVQGGRLVLDEPTDLPNGEVVELVPLDEVLASGGDYLDAEDRERLHASIDRGVDDARAGRTTDARQVMAELRARASGR